jgi:2-polyprenyl-3-methyl-5-hydroxy-6-metoxy-1,4-benzoquinol methylase
VRRADSSFPWLRFDDEASGCPACGSTRLTLLDALSVARTAKNRLVSFLTGCYECGLVFSNPLPTEPEMERLYDRDGKWAVLRAEKRRHLEAAHLKRQNLGVTKTSRRFARDALLDALAAYIPIHTPPAGATVIDFGCGEGKFLNRLQDRGWQTYGIEPSGDVAFLRHHRLLEPPEDGTFDLAVLHHVLEHVTEPLTILRQLAASVRNGGWLFVSVPRLDTLGRHRDFKYCINGRTHLMCFSETCLRGLLARAGFAPGPALHAAELDDILSEGKPLRLRLIATRTMAPQPLPEAPLEAALKALSAYARNETTGARMRRLLPVRMRAALLDRARAS